MNFCVPIALLASLLFSISGRTEVVSGLKNEDTLSVCTEPDFRLLYRFKPRCEETIVRSGRTSVMRYNSLGLRDIDYAAKPKRGWRRILFLGASSDAGPGIAAEETTPKRLEALLRQRWPKTEVINAGVEGYGPLQLSISGRKLLQEYSPTHVIVDMSLSAGLSMDLINSAFLREDGQDDMRLVPFYPSWVPKIRGTGFSALGPRLVRTAYAYGERARLSWLCRIRGWLGGDVGDCLLRYTEKAATTFLGDARKRSIPVLLLLPSIQISNNTVHIVPVYHFPLARLLDAMTPGLSLAPDPFAKKMEAAGSRVSRARIDGHSRNFLPQDFHYSPQGADAFARAILPDVTSFLSTEKTVR